MQVPAPTPDSLNQKLWAGHEAWAPAVLKLPDAPSGHGAQNWGCTLSAPLATQPLKQLSEYHPGLP